MKPQSVIIPLRDHNKAQVDARIANLEGRQYVRKPTFYRNTETNQEYYAIVGSIAFSVGLNPGFGLVIGVIREPDEKAPLLQVLAEIEEQDLVSRLTACEKIRYRWGYPHQLEYFIGDAGCTCRLSPISTILLIPNLKDAKGYISHTPATSKMPAGMPYTCRR